MANFNGRNWTVADMLPFKYVENWDAFFDDVIAEMDARSNGVGEASQAAVAAAQATAADRQQTGLDRVATDQAAANAQAWAEGTEPGGPGTRSSKGWAGEAEGAATRAEQAAASIAGGPVPSGRQIATSGSLTGGRDLSADLTLSLMGDVANPGPSKVYGTDKAGVRGFYTVDPSGGAAAVSSAANVTLTTESARVQAVTLTAAGKSVMLPNATALSTGGPVFVIHNAGNLAFGVRDSAGKLLAAVPAAGVAELYLDDNATAAGSWTVTGRGLEPALVAVDATLPSTYTTVVEVACRLTDTLSVHFAQNASGHLFAVAADSAGGTVGTPAAVDVSGSMIARHCFAISSTQAVVFWIDASNNHKAAVLTVDPTTRAVSVGTAASTGTTFLSNASFTGRQVIAQLTPTQFVALYGNGGYAVAISVTGSTVSIGAGVATGASTVQQVLACYRVSDTTALALCVDGGSEPYNLYAAVLSVSGTTIAVGSGSRIVGTCRSGAFPTAQLTPTSYIVGYNGSGGAVFGNAVAATVTVSGITPTWGAPLSVIAFNFLNLGDLDFGANNASRFQPNLFRLSDTTALFTVSQGSPSASRHYVLTNSGGALTAGPGLFGVWSGTTAGGNFPQTPQGFLAVSAGSASGASGAESVHGVTVSGTSLEVTGSWCAEGFFPNNLSSRRFGLSGGVAGIVQASNGSGLPFTSRPALLFLFRFRSGGAPQFVGRLPLPNTNMMSVAAVPVEIAPSKAAFSAYSLTQSGSSTASVRLLIVEFAQ